MQGQTLRNTACFQIGAQEEQKDAHILQSTSKLITQADTSEMAELEIDENIDEINKAISTISKGNRLEGSTYTNGNLNREI